jgi:hypothetical protein
MTHETDRSQIELDKFVGQMGIRGDELLRGRAETDVVGTAPVVSAAVMGGLAAARATAKADPGLSDDILVAVRQILVEIGSKSKPSTRKSQIKR